MTVTSIDHKLLLNHNGRMAVATSWHLSLHFSKFHLFRRLAYQGCLLAEGTINHGGFLDVAECGALLFS
jgi:hypothetical protein